MENLQEKAWKAIIDEISRRIDRGSRGETTRIAKLLGYTRGTVSRWRSGALKGERIPFDRVCDILIKLGLRPSDYFPQLGPTWSLNPTGIPLIGLAACGHGWYNKTTMTKTVPHPPSGYQDAGMFAVLAIGSSMIPKGLEEGHIAYCDPSCRIDPDDIVFIERQDETVSLKVFKGVETDEKGNEWIVLNGWAEPNLQGKQKLVEIRELKSAVKRLIPVVFIKTKIN